MPRGRRRPDPLAGIWDSEIVAILETVPGRRPICIRTQILLATFPPRPTHAEAARWDLAAPHSPKQVVIFP
jgi:hypothetical protein